MQTTGTVKVKSLNTLLDSNQSENDENEHIQMLKYSLHIMIKINLIIFIAPKCFMNWKSL